MTSFDGECSMSGIQTAPQILDHVFLDVRAKLLEVAASLDRLDRAAGADAVGNDPRRQRVQKTLEILATQSTNRADTGPRPRFDAPRRARRAGADAL